MTEKKECNDPRCPIHGSLSTHGYRFTGTIVSDRMKLSVVVERPFEHRVAKYKRYEKGTTRITAHNPTCIGAKYGDTVVVEECRPLSKTKSFVVVEKVAGKESQKE